MMKPIRKSLVNQGKANSCYFRSSVEPPNRKALIQITEICNLHCAHCFVSSSSQGRSMNLKEIQYSLIPKLRQTHVQSVTITGGEPFMYPDLVRVVELCIENNMRVTLCTNATNITDIQMKSLSKMMNVSVNVSLDGFKPESHGVFRGDRNSFFRTTNTIERLGEYRLLKGLLVTPNNLASIEEYSKICEFAINNNAKYVLMNPLSRFGRGFQSQSGLGFSQSMMRQIQETCSQFNEKLEVVFIRFLNDNKPLSSCEAGRIFYVFADGAVAVCPYLVFAARNKDARHKPNEYIVANIFKDHDIEDALSNYHIEKRPNHVNARCQECKLEPLCGKGCPAAIIQSGQPNSGVDEEICPIL